MILWSCWIISELHVSVFMGMAAKGVSTSTVGALLQVSGLLSSAKREKKSMPEFLSNGTSKEFLERFREALFSPCSTHTILFSFMTHLQLNVHQMRSSRNLTANDCNISCGKSCLFRFNIQPKTNKHKASLFYFIYFFIFYIN